MNKLWLIIKREYLTRVTKRSFILGTLLTPLGIGALIFLNVKLATYKDDNFKKIAVLDQSGILKSAPENQKNLQFTLTEGSLDVLKKQVIEKRYDGILVVPPVTDAMNKNFTLKYYSDDKLGNDMSSDIADKIEEAIKKYKINELGLDTNKIAALRTRVEIDPDPIVGEQNASSISGYVAMAIGGFMGFFMYLAVFIYGMMIFRSVMEEKTSRIVEVIISSVKPFQLMLGKIIGVGAVGLTQFIIWAILMTGITLGASAMLGSDASKMGQNPAMGGMPQGAMANAEQIQQIDKTASLMLEIQSQNWWAIIPLFIIFFILGYLMYSSLFAAVGSAVGDDAGEAQSLTLPITLPVIIAIYIMMTAIRAPESSLAVWSSIFPLFSPIVMPARLPFNPPFWQVALSITLLVATVLFLVWLAGRIYRVGILMYGKKVTFKELGKWIFYKD
jgi:ABC-2 type transport system permease protein